MASNLLILVGSFTTFISALRFNTATNSLTYVTQTAVGVSPSWLTLNPTDSSIVYATEDQYYQSGSIYSLEIDASTGKLSQKGKISTQTTSGSGGSVSLDLTNDGREIAAANYNSGSAFFVSLGADMTSFSGSGQLVRFNGSGPLTNQRTAHAHQIVTFGKEIIVPDLGADRVWRLTKNNGQWTVNTASSVVMTPGSGPRHCVPLNGTIYVVHEMRSVVTQHTLPDIGSGQAPQLVANISIKPPDASGNAMKAAELLYAQSVTSGASPLLYASNRDDTNQEGDALAIFETEPALRLVKHVRTGLKHLRGVAFLGPNKEWIIAGGMNGGGIKIFKRVSADEGYLTQVAALASTQISQPAAFVWVKG